MKRVIIALILQIVVIGSTAFRSTAFAWGHSGHRVIGMLAQKKLCGAADSEVRRLLGTLTIAQAATWADEARDDAEYKYLAPWHYVTLPEGVPYALAPKSKKGDVVTAIEEQTAILADRAKPDSQRLLALKLLIHFVGDAHQPFHAGRPDDFGGNDVQVSWFGESRDLHWVWDTGLLRKTGQSEDQIVEELSGADLKEVVTQTTPEVWPGGWVDESAKLANAAYPEKAEGGSNLGSAYFEKHIATVKRRLREAGQRLGRVLNSAAGGCEASPSGHAF